MANFTLRLTDDLAARFDGWAAERGGRSPALRHLIERASGFGPRSCEAPGRLGSRTVKLSVRLAVADGRRLDAAAAEMGLTRNTWAAALIRRRLHARPTFRRSDELSLLGMRAELRRIGVNVNQIARALNTAVMEEGRVLDLELAYLDDLRAEIRAHMRALAEAFEGNLAYWQVDP
jgi:hypothetical protein